MRQGEALAKQTTALASGAGKGRHTPHANRMVQVGKEAHGRRHLTQDSLSSSFVTVKSPVSSYGKEIQRQTTESETVPAPIVRDLT